MEPGWNGLCAIEQLLSAGEGAKSKLHWQMPVWSLDSTAARHGRCIVYIKSRQAGALAAISVQNEVPALEPSCSTVAMPRRVMWPLPVAKAASMLSAPTTSPPAVCSKL